MSFLPYSGGNAGGWVAAIGSSAATHAALAALVIAMATQMGAPKLDMRPDFSVTLERLDSQTLAGLLEREGTVGADEGTSDLDTPAPDLAEPDPGEELAALTPEEVEVPEPDLAPEVAEEAEEVAPTEVEEVTAVEPEPITPEAIEPEPVQPTPIQPEALVPETVSPIIPEAGPVTAEALQPLAVAPLRPAPEVLRPAAPAPDQGQVVTALNARPAPAPSAAPRPPAPPPSAQDLAIGDLIRRIRTATANPCLLALPRRDGPDGIGLEMVAAQDGAMAEFTRDVLTADDGELRQTRTLVDPRQCAALTYVRQNRDYPATRLALSLDAAEVPSGGNLSGVLQGVGGKYVLLLLVDNNGVVQDLQRFMSFSGNYARFDVPVTRSGAPRDTSQLLLAIATQKPVTRIKDRAGRLAADVFSGLEGEAAGGAALAVTTFDVR